MTGGSKGDLDAVRERWIAAWPQALAVWSRFTKLPAPRWCMDAKDHEAEHLTGSFAMIRLQDHAVVIGIDEVVELGIEQFALEVLAHEVGHHVYAPGDLVDNARVLARIRRGLPSRESYAPMVSNLYTDLLINDRLQRSMGLDIAGVYAAIRQDNADPLWALYMRAYETLWALPFDTLVDATAVTAEIAADASLAARLIRVYARNWIDGAGRFAVLLLPYLLQMPEGPTTVAPWMDALSAGAGGDAPDGLAEIEDDEIDGAIHPADDPRINGLRSDYSDSLDPNYKGGGREDIGGIKNRYRSPAEYVELMRSLGVQVDERDLVIRYYRERALPHIVPFPARESREATDPLPEGLDVWDLGAPLSSIDWTETVVRSPLIIPGFTTVERVYGATQGTTPDRVPVDLYLGVDCSGSMTNPARGTSFPVIAGAVITLSALRAGAHVMVELSGDPGEFSATDGFVRKERDALAILTGYLGTGYAYGIRRLDASILACSDAFVRPIHLLIVTDSDIFRMLEDTQDGWGIFARAVEVTGGGATLVLDRSDRAHYQDALDRISSCGWDIHHVTDQEELVVFARHFARKHYQARSA